MIYIKFLKRGFDLIISLIGLLVLSPVFLIIFILLSISNHGESFFLQSRPGKDEHIFKIIKFKTMNDKKDVKGNLLPDADRLTWIGKIVRKTSLDEIPQLLNVIKGEMSLVGPRPLLIEYLPLYNKTQKRRHNVRPGITGWTQINGRNALSWEQKFDLDIWYVDRVSFLLDLKIIFKTIKKVIVGEGISADGEATAAAFKVEDQ